MMRKLSKAKAAVVSLVLSNDTHHLPKNTHHGRQSSKSVTPTLNKKKSKANERFINMLHRNLIGFRSEVIQKKFPETLPNTPKSLHHFHP